MFDLLERTGELAGTTGARAFLAGRSLLTYDIGVQRTRAFFWKMKFFCTSWPLVDHDIDHLRNHVASALDDDGIADPYIAAVTQLFPVTADAPDVVLVVQRDVLHDDAADADRLQFADRCKRAGAPDLNLDIAQHRRRPFGGEFMRDRPPRRTGDEAEAFLPVEAVDLVDDAVDVVIEFGARFLDLAVKCDQLFDRVTELGQRVGLEAATLEPAYHAGLRILRHRTHLTPGIGKETERPRSGDAGVFLAQRTGRGIARIGEDSIARGLLAFVEREKRLFGHVDFAAHLADVGHLPAF